ncbi:keratin-associated protein 9-1 [Cherax quadricarinatus]|uniref:keratin-associated protein 9-1 n=1 Tax=Cherax quadricarinatus TaxID=27406 RepID=UPI002379B59B|nr:keratin-associated protein 5-5-like [Cherax quadricarinatus]
MRVESNRMGVEQVTLPHSWNNPPLPAIFCIAIAIYILLVIIGLCIRQCLLKKGVCGGGCQQGPCCSCAELGLHCAQTCCNWGPKPTCSSLLDHCCPTAHQGCNCLKCLSCEMCSCNTCTGDICQDSCKCCSGWCVAPGLCTVGSLCNTCYCTTPQCSTINCMCCEITIKGRGPQQET